jgi:hypothetical protein
LQRSSDQFPPTFHLYLVPRPKSPSNSFHPQPSEAEAAFLALQSEIEALREPQRAQIDVQRASAIAHSVVTRDQEPARLSHLERLAEVELYDLALPERVAQLARATWFVRQRQLGLVALSSAASVPPDVLRDAQLRRRTMLKVLEHWFDDDAGIAAEVAVIREGAGYQDLANDLEALADIYQRPAVHAGIAEDRKHYDRNDARSARALAKAIFAGLGLGRENDAQRWASLCSRAWTLLLQSYDEHRAAGIFLFRDLEDVAETYPSLVTAARRSPPSRLTSRDEGEEQEPEAPIDEDGDDTDLAADLPEAANA